MPKVHVLVVAAIVLGLGTSCQQSNTPAPVAVRVLRDPYFAADLSRTNIQFVKTEPHVRGGRAVELESKDDVPYMDRTRRLRDFAPQVWVFYSQDFVPDDPSVRNQLGEAELLCGIHPAFIPISVSGEQREAAEMYVRFMAAQCPKIAIQSATNTTAEATEQPDPHRPPCTSAGCKKIKKFLKDHYCGESPFGNGPEDGCNYKKAVRNGNLTADYSCKWNEAKATSECRQERQPSKEAREILIRELLSLGLPPRGEGDVFFSVVESTSGWSLMSANYDHIDGPNLTLCEVVVAADQSGRTYVLRKVKLKKTDADVPNVTTWSPLDIADVNGDGQPEMVLRGDAYEDHWLEVISIEDDSFKTIFSGLGYYL
jgi:hypothetical protein